jgi:hypothetical protein
VWLPRVSRVKPASGLFDIAGLSFLCIFANILRAFVYTLTPGCAIDSPFAAMHAERKTRAGRPFDAFPYATRFACFARVR